MPAFFLKFLFLGSLWSVCLFLNCKAPSPLPPSLQEILRMKAKNFFQAPASFEVLESLSSVPQWPSMLKLEVWQREEKGREDLSEKEKNESLSHFLLRAALYHHQKASWLLVLHLLEEGPPAERILALQWGLQSLESPQKEELLKKAFAENQPISLRLFAGSLLAPATLETVPWYQESYEKERDWRLRSLLCYSTLENLQARDIQEWLERYPGDWTSALARKFLGAPRNQSIAQLKADLQEPSSPYLKRNPLFRKRFLPRPEENPLLRLGYLYLARHQEENGSFDCSKHNPFHQVISLPGFSYEDDQVDVALTALVLLGFLARGNTDSYGVYADLVYHSKNFLLQCQNEEGRFQTQIFPHQPSEVFVPYHETRQNVRQVDPRSGVIHLVRRYNHVIALLALLELYGMNEEEALYLPLKKGLAELSSPQTVHGKTFSFYIELTDVATTAYTVQCVTLAEQLGLGLSDSSPT
jgi:hypothetical protein